MPNPHGRKPVLLTGEYGRLTATDDYDLRPRPDGRNRVWQRFDCACGGEVWAPPHRIRSANTNSCGCFHRDRASEANTTHGATAKRGTVRGPNHGHSKTRLYRIWKAMRRRCLVPAASNYKWYGGRGISIDSSWDDYVVFRTWALSNGYADDLEIDRINNDGNYEPSNCRWITKRENVSRARSARTGALSS